MKLLCFLFNVSITFLMCISVVHAADSFRPLSSVLAEAEKNNDSIAYVYVLKRCGALMGAVAGFESDDNRAEAKNLVKLNNQAAEFFISTALNYTTKNKTQTTNGFMDDMKQMTAVYVDNFKKNRVLSANIFSGTVGEDYSLCGNLYKKNK